MVLPAKRTGFYLRELPWIQAVLAKLDDPPEVIVVDGYVWLDEQESPGLGPTCTEPLASECR